MKKLFVLALAAGFVLTSCGSKQEEKKSDDDAYSDYETAESDKKSSDEGTPLRDLIAQGEALLNASDCKTCHTVENRIVGPSYNDVAGKYSFTTENVAFLSEKVITGGAGNWGDIPMTAHPNVSKADAEKMIYYVLSLDGEEFKQQ